MKSTGSDLGNELIKRKRQQSAIILIESVIRLRLIFLNPTIDAVLELCIAAPQ